MYRNYYQYPNEERFIGPVLPFIGGALIGYVVGRPNFNTGTPYYPPYYYQPYYQQPYYIPNQTYINK